MKEEIKKEMSNAIASYVNPLTDSIAERCTEIALKYINQPPVAVAWPSEDKINIKCKSLEFELGDVAARKIVDFIKQSTKVIDLEDFLKWYNDYGFKKNIAGEYYYNDFYKGVLFLNFHELIAKYNEHLNKN